MIKSKKTKPKQKPKTIITKKKLNTTKGSDNVDLDDLEMDIDRDDGYDFM
jgi:hypothetical protein